MTFYNNFQNLNMSYLSNGLSSWFTPSFGMFNQFMPFNFNWNMPSLFSNFNWNSPVNWNMQSLFNFYTPPQPKIDFSNLYSETNIFNPKWNNIQDNYTFTFDTFTRTTPAAKTITSKTKTASIKYNTSPLQLENYNEKFGKRLAETALEYTKYRCNRNTKTIDKSRSKSSYDWDGLCATYVKMAIRDSGGGNYVNGDAHQMVDILSKNKNFKRISTNVDLASLPAGCVLVYDKGVGGYSSRYGHTELTLGDGRAASDGITKNLNKKPTAIFMPTYA